MRQTAVASVRTARVPTTDLTTNEVAEPKRQWLTEDEVEALMRAAGNDRDRAAACGSVLPGPD